MVRSKRQCIWRKNSDPPSCKLKLLKKHMDLETYQQLFTMISACIVHPIFGMVYLKCNENAVFSFKNTQNKDQGPLFV